MIWRGSAFAAALCVLAIGALAAEQPDVTVFAATSLTNALQDIGKDFEANGGGKVKFSFAASSLLARQIEAGAEADVFFSADAEWMAYLDQRKLIVSGSRRDLLSNRLALVAPAESAITLKIEPGFPLAKALGDGRLAIAEPETVPAGKYAKAALTKLGVWDSVSGKLAPAENVRAALMYVARGEAMLGIVYTTDVKAERKVKTVDTFPADTHPAIVYPAALTGTAKDEAKAFFAVLGGAKAKDVFVRYGFVVK